MRIDLSNSIAQQIAGDSSTKKGGKPQPSTLPPEDKASFSQAAHSVRHLVESALAPSAARSERVAALRDAVSSGTYSVDAEAVAGAMIQESGN
jgi:flagellar biosynthesis anti-sigma factor FlgM